MNPGPYHLFQWIPVLYYKASVSDAHSKRDFQIFSWCFGVFLVSHSHYTQFLLAFTVQVLMPPNPFPLGSSQTGQMRKRNRACMLGKLSWVSRLTHTHSHQYSSVLITVYLNHTSWKRLTLSGGRLKKFFQVKVFEDFLLLHRTIFLCSEWKRG